MLELKNICYEVEDNKEIIRDISLQIEDHFVAITGPNGGGKSTLAKIIAGIVTPTSGQILGWRGYHRIEYHRACQ